MSEAEMKFKVIANNQGLFTWIIVKDSTISLITVENGA